MLNSDFMHVTRCWSFLFLVLFMGLGSAFSFAGNDPDEEKNAARALRESEQIDSFINSLHNSGYFNGTLLVARGQNIVYQRSMGYANYITGDSITNEMPYQMASVSKPITASAVMLLVQRGEIDLEDRITKYFPELMVYHKVRVKHLLNHTSGLPEYIHRAKSYWNGRPGYMTNADLIRFLSLKKYKLVSTPGSKFSYCNTNYALLASLVERITEQKFADFVKAEIFEPLGMKHSYIFDPSRDTSELMQIKGYHWTGKRWQEYGFDYRNGVVGDKGMYSNAEDMMRFAIAFGAEELWCKETCEQIFSKTGTYGGLSEYGLGWRMREWEEKDVVLHYGFWNSFRTAVIHFPESDVTIVILNNFTGAKGSRTNNRELIIHEVMAAMFPQEEPILILAEEQVIPSDPEPPLEGGGTESED